MKIIADLHTHSIASGHSFGTIEEMAKVAKAKGLKLLAITDHGPALPGAPTYLYFKCVHLLPEYINNVKIIGGVEANILNKKGELDLPDEILANQDIVLAGFHYDVGYTTNNIKDNTEAIINVLQNPEVDIIAHIANSSFPVDLEIAVKIAKENNKIFEINNRCFVGGSRKNSEEYISKLIQLCLENEVKLIITSDAHSQFQVGCFSKAIQFAIKNGVREENILNTNYEKLIEYLNSIHKNKRAREKVE
ncbi:MAG TPA: phosphatase [bacterium]|nr:phosphatase [bacterium]HOL48622.1 phosphatase [bacterium]HPQ19036.1 phosphatase [bacterium]